MPLAEVLANPAKLKPTLIYAPTAREALQGASATKDMLLVSILDNVRGRTLLFKPGPSGSWQRSALDLPDNSTIAVADTSHTDDRALLTVTSFLTPPSQWLVDAGKGAARQIRQQPPKFDAAGLVAEQFEAVSSDGTKVPYFVVHRRDLKLDGNNPTLMHAYGGFEVAQTPSYSPGTGKLWLERGGVYVLANIRGGGEFGPAWHEAGLKTKRQIIYDDFAAVGRDLRRARSPARAGSASAAAQRRAVDRRVDDPAPRIVERGDHRHSIARHAAHLEDRGRRVVGRRIWQRHRPRGARVLGEGLALP